MAWRALEDIERMEFEKAVVRFKSLFDCKPDVIIALAQDRICAFFCADSD